MTTTCDITASGHSLRELLQEATGYDPFTEPVFAWSNRLPCSECEIHDSTAVVALEDGSSPRLCFHCLLDAL